MQLLLIHGIYPRYIHGKWLLAVNTSINRSGKCIYGKCNGADLHTSTKSAQVSYFYMFVIHIIIFLIIGRTSRPLHNNIQKIRTHFAQVLFHRVCVSTFMLACCFCSLGIYKNSQHRALQGQVLPTRPYSIWKIPPE